MSSSREAVHRLEDGFVLPFHGSLLDDAASMDHAGDEKQHREADILGSLTWRAGRENREGWADKSEQSEHDRTSQVNPGLLSRADEVTLAGED